MGWGEVGGCTRRVQTAWLGLDLAMKRPWLEPGRRVYLGLSIYVNGARKQLICS